MKACKHLLIARSEGMFGFLVSLIILMKSGPYFKMGLHHLRMWLDDDMTALCLFQGDIGPAGPQGPRGPRGPPVSFAVRFIYCMFLQGCYQGDI
jgi:hypothetical protein